MAPLVPVTPVTPLLRVRAYTALQHRSPPPTKLNKRQQKLCYENCAGVASCTIYIRYSYSGIGLNICVCTVIYKYAVVRSVYMSLVHCVLCSGVYVTMLLSVLSLFSLLKCSDFNWREVLNSFQYSSLYRSSDFD